MQKSWKLISAAVLLVAAVSGTSYAQVGWLNPEGKPGVQFETSLGSFKGYSFMGFEAGFAFPTGSMFLTLHSRMTKDICGVMELPAFNTKYKVTTPLGSISESKFGFANPYFGIEFGRPGSSATIAIGARLPLISVDNAGWSVATQYVESQRSLAYLRKVIPVSFNAGYRFVNQIGSGASFKAGGQLAIPDRGDAEFFGELATNFWYKTGKVRIMGAFGGLILITESDIDLGDRILANLSVASDLTLGSWQPGAHIRLPIDRSVGDALGIIYGVHLAYLFPQSGK